MKETESAPGEGDDARTDELSEDPAAGSTPEAADTAAADADAGEDTGRGADAASPAARIAAIALALTAVAAVVAAIVGLVFWVRADDGSDDPRAALVADASQAVLNLTSSGEDDPAEHLERMRSSVTGELLAEVDDFGSDIQQVADDMGLVVRPRLHSVTISSFDESAGTATVLATVAQDMIMDGSRMGIRRLAVDVELRRNDAGVWQASSFHTLYDGADPLPGYGGDGAGPADGLPTGADEAEDGE